MKLDVAVCALDNDIGVGISVTLDIVACASMCRWNFIPEMNLISG